MGTKLTSKIIFDGDLSFEAHDDGRLEVYRWENEHIVEMTKDQAVDLMEWLKEHSK